MAATNNSNRTSPAGGRRKKENVTVTIDELLDGLHARFARRVAVLDGLFKELLADTNGEGGQTSAPGTTIDTTAPAPITKWSGRGGS